MNYSTQPIIQKLKKTREKMGLTQRELSVQAGVPQSHISKIESGSIEIRSDKLQLNCVYR